MHFSGGRAIIASQSARMRDHVCTRNAQSQIGLRNFSEDSYSLKQHRESRVQEMAAKKSAKKAAKKSTRKTTKKSSKKSSRKSAKKAK
jgi:hypothetical protein